MADGIKCRSTKEIMLIKIVIIIIIMVIIILLVIINILGDVTSLVQRRYKKSKVKKTLSFKQIKDNKHEHFSVLTHITLF